MKVTVDTEIVMAVGRLEDAVVLSHIAYWVEQNRQQDANFHDGEYWMFNSAVKFHEAFPFWSVDVIKRILRRLKEGGWILVGNYNKRGFDKTQWYTLAEPAKILMGQNCTIDGANLHHPRGKIAPPIPNINTNNNTKDNTNNNLKEYKAQDAPPPPDQKWTVKKAIEGFTDNQEVREALLAFMECRKRMRVPNTERAVKLLLQKLQPHAPDIQLAMLNKSIERGWKGLFELKEQDYTELGYKHEVSPQQAMVNRVIAKMEREEQEYAAKGYDSEDYNGIFGGFS